MYDEASIPISPMPDIPEGCDPVSLHESAEFKSYQSGDEMPSIKNRVSDEYARKLRHAYFACVSYMDAQVGKVLDALEASGKMDNTIIILWGDHGWHLGDLRVWGKHTLHETSLSSALVIKAPSVNQGLKITGLSVLSIFIRLLWNFAKSPYPKDWTDIVLQPCSTILIIPNGQTPLTATIGIV